MRKMLMIIVLLTSVAYGQQVNNTPTKFVNGLLAPNPSTSPVTGFGSLWFNSGKIAVHNGTIWQNLLSETLAGTTYTPLARTITINGISFDLSANRSWTITSSAPDTTVYRTVSNSNSLSALQTKLNLKANLASPTFTGAPTLPTGTIGVTQTAGNSTTALATTAFVTTANNLKANIASPTFTGVPAAPTATAGTSTTQLATTAFATTANNLKQNLVSLTTTGTSGAATFNQSTGALNIPNYAGGGGSGTVTSITPGIGFNSATPITTSGTLNLDTVTTSTGIARKGFVTNYTYTKAVQDATYVPKTTTVAGFPLSSNVTLATLTRGYALTGSNYNGSAAQTFGVDTTKIMTITDYQTISSNKKFQLATFYGANSVKYQGNGTVDLTIQQYLGRLTFLNPNPTVNWAVSLGSSLLTADRVYEFPNVTGTIALQSDVSSYPYLLKSADYTVTAADWGTQAMLTIVVDATAGNITVTLPTASTVVGKVINVSKSDASANTVTVSAASIGNGTTVVISAQDANSQIQSISSKYIKL